MFKLDRDFLTNLSNKVSDPLLIIALDCQSTFEFAELRVEKVSDDSFKVSNLANLIDIIK